MSLVKLGRSQNTYTRRGFRALASTNGAFGNTGRASDSMVAATRRRAGACLARRDSHWQLPPTTPYYASSTWRNAIAEHQNTYSYECLELVQLWASQQFMSPPMLDASWDLPLPPSGHTYIYPPLPSRVDLRDPLC